MKIFVRAFFSAIIAGTSFGLFAQTNQSGVQYYLSSVHNGNRVKTVFGNWGVIGQPNDTRPRGAWKYESNGYIGDVSLLVGAEIKMPNNILFHSVVSCPVARPTKAPDTSPTGDPWTLMPVDGYASKLRKDGSKNQSIAMNDDDESWPSKWPDKLTDPSDPGWPGVWNGYFGKRASADQESYFVMDDNNDVRYNFSVNNVVNGTGVSFRPNSQDSGRNGLGLVVRVRGLQWNQTIAQDNIFWLYEIDNTSTTTYDRVVFGMIVGTYVGVTGQSSDRYQEYDDDWSFYDVDENITYTGDFTRNNSRNPFWKGAVGMVGYAFLESPGNALDGIDNDNDIDKWVPASALPKFAPNSFDSAIVTAGSTVILIKDDFSRVAFTVPNSTVKVKTRGLDSITIIPGFTRMTEGNRITVGGKVVISSSAYDGADNDLDGIIDENYFLHYRQVKFDPVSGDTLINILRPVRYFNYKATTVTDPLAMVDERRDDHFDNDNDWDLSFDDTGTDGIFDPLNPDFGEKDGIPTSGERNFDQTDVDESDQIGLTSFIYFTNSADPVDLRDDENLWVRLQPGSFSVPPSIENNKPVSGEDGDFIYGSGYFPLQAKKIERLSLALVYGGGNGGSREDDIADLLKHKITVQKIYDANYQFPIAPDPAPTLKAVAGDGKVQLYWDRKSESAVDPVLRYKDFQGYKIFKATDREFNDAFSVTDANGIAKRWAPTFQVDLDDSITGIFYPPQDILQGEDGLTFKLGGNTGLVHDTTDYEVMNGRTYYYVVVAYDNGDFKSGIMPSQNTWKITVDASGRVTSTSSNVAIVTPKPKVLGYSPPPSAKELTKIKSDGTGQLLYRLIDEDNTLAHTYDVTFNDTRDSGKFDPVTTSYTVRDSAYYTETFIPAIPDTLYTLIERKFVVPGTITITNLDGSVVPSTEYIINYERGAIRAKTLGKLQPNPSSPKKYKVRYQYYPVYRSNNINSSIFTKETKDTDIFDGVQIVFKNEWGVNLVDTLSGFTTGLKSYLFTFSAVTVVDPGNPSNQYIPTRYPSDYDIIFSDTVGVDSTGVPIIDPTKIPVNFRIRNRTDNRFVRFLMSEAVQDGQIGRDEALYLFDYDEKDSLRYTWNLTFTERDKDSVYRFKTGDTLKIRTTKPFRKGDMFTFRTEKPVISKAVVSEDLNQIRVVPNPYVVASVREAPNPSGTFGRGERKIEFQHVPSDAKISIFTVRGDLIRVLNADGTLNNGTVKWDVKTSENLDVAFGVYFYAVESSIGTKTGKIAIIK